MDTTELVLLLSGVSGVGDMALSRILRRNAVLRRSADDFLACSDDEMRAEYRLTGPPLRALREAARHRDNAVALARVVRRAGISVLTEADAAYPSSRVAVLNTPPPVLYAFGNLGALGKPLFCVANSNSASAEALAASDCASELAVSSGWTPVTGHNRPAYQRSALVARREGASVVYVLDRGIVEAFDGDLSRDLFAAARIWSPTYDATTDLTLSPFGLEHHGIATHNRRRDEIVFALAELVIAGDVRAGGIMERECLSALRAGKRAFLVGPAETRNRALLDAGAVPVCSPSLDVLLATLGRQSPRTSPEDRVLRS